MNRLILIFTIVFTQNLFAQVKDYYSCEELKKVVLDNTIFDTLPNGKMIARIHKENNKIYLVTVDDNIFYYISDNLIKLVKQSIRKNRCKNIKVKKVKKIDAETKIIRD